MLRFWSFWGWGRIRICIWNGVDGSGGAVGIHDLSPFRITWYGMVGIDCIAIVCAAHLWSSAWYQNSTIERYIGFT